MKKRLSLLLAVLMIVSLLPVSAFAAADPLINPPTVSDTEPVHKTTVSFRMERNKGLQPGKLQFWLKNAELAQATTTVGPVTAEVEDWYVAPEVTHKAANTDVSDTQAVVQDVKPDTDVPKTDQKKVSDKRSFTINVPNAVVATENYVYLTLDLALDLSESADGDVVLEVTDFDNKVGIGTQNVKLAVIDSREQGLNVRAREEAKEVSYDGGEVARFDVEKFKFSSATTTNESLAIMLDPDEYYAFDKDQTVIYIDGVKASSSTIKWDAHGYAFYIEGKDLYSAKSVMVIPVIEKMGMHASEGTIEVEARLLSHPGKSPNIAKYFDGDKTVKSATAVIGKVVDYKVSMTVVEKNKKEIPSLWGGEQAKVTVTLKGPKGSFSKRGVEFSVTDAGVLQGSVQVTKHVKGKKSDLTVSDVKGLVDAKAIYKDAYFVVEGVNEETTEVSFDMTIQVPFDKNGTATIKAAQRGWETSADLAKVTPKFTVSTEATDMKKGEVKETANIVITEAKEGLLRPNHDSLTLLFKTTRDYIEFAEKGKVEATNGMEFGKGVLVSVDTPLVAKEEAKGFTAEFKDVELKGSKAMLAVILPIKKKSKDAPAVITISGIKTRVDGSTVDGTYDVKAGINGHTVASAAYVKVVKEYGLEPVVSKFVVGQTQYDVNGKAMTAASAPYIKNGRTMLPIRAVAESLGLHVQWNGATKTATFTDSTKVAAIVVGADTMHVNGTPIKLSAKSELVNGTTFVELRSLATAFGVQIDWDAAAKTATVSK